MTNSRLVGGVGLLTDCCCSVNLAYFRLTWLTGVDGSTGVWKAVRIALQMPSFARRFHVFDCPFKIGRLEIDLKLSKNPMGYPWD